MRTLYLVRHGKPDFPGGEKQCIGRTDLPLSAEGREEIEALRASFAEKGIERIYTSPLTRCVQSAEILSGGVIPVEIVDGLREIDMGLWDGLTFREIRERYPAEYEARGMDLANFRPPEGESFSDCAGRAARVFREIQAQCRGNVILVGHAGFFRTLIAGREKKALKNLLDIPLPYGAVYPWTERIFDAMIVAAGMSSRMGDFKPLLDLGGRTVIAREIETLQKGGAREVVVVTGHREEELRAAAAGPGVRFLHNAAYADTKMFDSVCMGLSYYNEKRNTPEGASLDGIFFLPVDVPLTTVFTMEYEKYRFEDGTGDVYCPYHGGAPGHPLLIRISALPALLSHDGERGLKGAYERLGERVIHLDVTDRGCVMDADTPEEFERLIRYLETRNIPDEAACEELLAWFGTPEETVRHCRAVADMAVKIGEACNRQAGQQPFPEDEDVPRHLSAEDGQRQPLLDISRIRAGAMLHDIAKAWPDHAAAGARWLSLLGHEGVAEMVADHMDIPEDRLQEINESLVVYLADKMVQGERRVTLKERFAAKRERFRDNPAALSGVERRYALAKRAEELARRKGYTE